MKSMMTCFISIYIFLIFFLAHASLSVTSIENEDSEDSSGFDYGYGSFVADPEEIEKSVFLDTCSIFIAQSLNNPYTHGLYAGHGFTKSYGISLRYPAGRFQMLDRISEPEGIDGKYRILSLGPNALLPKTRSCNAKSSAPLTLRYSDHRINSPRYLDRTILPQVKIYQPLSARTKYPNFDYLNASVVEVGQELVVGTSVCDANDESSQSKMISYDDLIATGTCLDNVEVKPSHAGQAGLGVFAKCNLQAGQIVAITPVAILPMREVYKASDEFCVLINYCLGHSHSDIALLPLGSVAFLNHGVQNVEYEWHFWDSDATQANALLNLSPKQLLEKAAASETPLLYLVYRSKFDLHAGQELQIDYGPAWELNSRQYYFDMENFAEFSGPLPQLRRHILVDEGLFPMGWLST